jgi:3-hydroxybutyryl-CoA dehydratase
MLMYMSENKYTLKFRFNQEQVIQFASVTGDMNPIHLDDEYASKSIFKRKIIHGFLGASVFSKIFGTEFPGEGTLYLKQSLKFLAPMFVETDYIAQIEIESIDKEKKRAKAITQIKDSSGKIIIDGEAVVQNEIYGLN